MRSAPTMAAPIRVLIADDHAVVREGVRHVLAAEPGFDVVGEASDGAETVRLAAELGPDVVVLDISMPKLSGFEAAEQIRRRTPDARILVLSIHDHEEYVLKGMRLGADGYLRKDSTPAELRRAIRAVHGGSTAFTHSATPTPAAAIHAEERMADLTARERDVLVGIASGETNKAIAARFGISVRTVEAHRESVMRKLGLRGAASLTRFAIEAGLVPQRLTP
jgi:DNA-binding NarL/FixJ family response regulator